MKRNLMGVMMLGVAIFAGCEREGSTAAGKEAAAKRAAAEATEKAAADRKDAADEKIAAEVKAASDLRAANAKAAADLKAASDAKMAAEAKIAADLKKAEDAKKAAEVAAEAGRVKAVSLLEQLLGHIQEGKLELAGTTLKQLDEMKSSIPAAVQEKVEAARLSLKAKEASAKLPG